MARARTKVNYNVIYGYTTRVDGLVRKDAHQVTRIITGQARINVTLNSRKRWYGFKRTGKLARSISDSHRWANQYGCGRTVSASALSPGGYNYATVVHRGTKTDNVVARERDKSTGRFKAGLPKFMPVGLSQGMVTTKKRRVRGQRGNPYLTDAMRTVLRMKGYTV